MNYLINATYFLMGSSVTAIGLISLLFMGA